MPDYQAWARRAARKYGLDEDLFVAQIGAESNFDPNARSPAGAGGIAQIMPATARGWGVDPYNPEAALDAAAKNMSQYVKQYGGYRNALVAYNAGPGRVGKPLYDETRKYIDKIMGASKRRTGEAPAASIGNLQSSSPTPQTTQPNVFSQIAAMAPVDQNANPQLQQLQETTRKNWELMGQILNQQQASTPTVAKTTSSTTSKSPITGGKGGKPHEFFFDPLGGWDNGTNIGAIGGHSDHIHIAAEPELLAQIAAEAAKRGLSVREYAPYDKVDPVHTKGSWHYKNRAADISGPGMAEFAEILRRRFGLK